MAKPAVLLQSQLLTLWPLWTVMLPAALATALPAPARNSPPLRLLQIVVLVHRAAARTAQTPSALWHHPLLPQWCRF